MKNFTYILPLLLLPLIGLAQNNKTVFTDSDAISYKNKISCDFELLLHANCTYKRKVTNKVAIGFILGAGLKGGVLWNNHDDFERENILPDGLVFGPLLNYKISKKWSYEFSPQYSIFLNPNFVDGVAFELDRAAIGFKNTIRN